MGTKLEELVVKLTLENAQYKKRLKDSAKATEKSTKKIKKSVKSTVASFIKWTAVVLAARKAYQVFTKTMSDVDALAKAADKLGITTEGLAGLRHAAQLTGIESNKLDMSIQRMTRRVAEASIGMGEAQGALNELGIEAKELAKLAPDEMFIRIARSITTVQNPADRLRIAFKLFDSEGADLVRTLALGEKGLRKMAAEAKVLGLAVSRVDAKKIEDANDAFTRLEAAAKGVMTELTVAFAPFLEKKAKQVAFAIRWWREEFEALRRETEVARLVEIFGPEAEASIRKQLIMQARLRQEREKAQGAGGGLVLGAPTTEQLEEGIDQLKVYWHRVANFTKKAQSDIIEATTAHEKEKTKIERDEEAARLQLRRANRQQQLGAASSMLGSLATLMDDGSRKAFKRSKDFARASATVNMGAAIMQALGHADPWTGAALATAAALKGAEQIALINRTQYGGGGGAGAAGGGGAGAAGAGAPAPRPIDVNVGLQGERFGPSAVRELIGAIDDQLGDGVTMRSITVN